MAQYWGLGSVHLEVRELKIALVGGESPLILRSPFTEPPFPPVLPTPPKKMPVPLIHLPPHPMDPGKTSVGLLGQVNTSKTDPGRNLQDQAWIGGIMVVVGGQGPEGFGRIGDPLQSHQYPTPHGLC